MKPPEPSQDQLLAMAYSDGELSGEECTAFEARLADEPDLAQEVARHREILVLSRELAPPEPADHEWARLELDPLHRSGNQLGMFLLSAGTLGLSAFGIYNVAAGDLEPFPKACLLALIAGSAALLLTTIQGRLRTRPLDPYRSVKR